MQSFAAFRSSLSRVRAMWLGPGDWDIRPGVTRREVLSMALLSPKVIAQVNVRSTGEVGVMSWEWIMRADGQVYYRLSKIDGRRERNAWTLATRLSAAELDALRGDQAKATAALDAIVRQRGYRR